MGTYQMLAKPAAHNHNFWENSRPPPSCVARKVHFLPHRQFDCPGEHQIHQVSSTSTQALPATPRLNIGNLWITNISVSRPLSGPPLQLSSPKNSITRVCRLVRIFADDLHFALAELAIMGISRDSRHKRSASGAKRAYYRA